MATVVVNDANGSWSLADLNSPEFANATLTTQTSSLLVFTATNGLSLRLSGNFTASSPYSWTLSSISILSNGTSVFSISDFSMNFYAFASSGSGSLESTILAGSDNIRSSLTSGQQWLAYGGNDTIQLGTGNDTVFGGSGTDTFILNANFDSIQLAQVSNGIQVISQYGTDLLNSVEILRLNDRVIDLTAPLPATGSGSGDTGSGGNSGHEITGTGTDETLEGTSGDDTLSGRGGDDTLNLRQGDDIGHGGRGHDLLQGANGNDRLLGNAGRDSLYGGDDSDRLLGGKRGDLLNGGSGDDRLVGQAGNDTLIGGTGNDLLIGGTGRDHFVFASQYGSDTIQNFETGRDRIHITSGANDLDDLTLVQLGDNVRLTFSDVSVLILETTITDLEATDSFLF